MRIYRRRIVSMGIYKRGTVAMCILRGYVDMGHFYEYIQNPLIHAGHIAQLTENIAGQRLLQRHAADDEPYLPSAQLLPPGKDH